MKILHLIYDDLKNPWLGGGGAQRTLDIYKRLSKRHQIWIITGNYPQAKEFAWDSIHYLRAGFIIGKSLSFLNYLLSRITYTVGVWQYIRRLDFDLLVDDFSAYSPTFSFLLKRKPVILSIRTIFSSHILKKYGPLGIGYFLLERVLIRFYHNFIANSPNMERSLRKILSSSRECLIKTIPNGIDNKLFEKMAIELPEKSFILFLGRIDIFEKGLDLLIQAYDELIKESFLLPDLVICGGGKDYKKLTTLIDGKGLEKKIGLQGWVYGEQKLAYLKSCLFLVLPSRYESWGNVILEAAACGKAVLATRIGGLTDTVIDAETGLLIAPDSVKALKKGIVRLVVNKSLRDRLGKAGIGWARNFLWDNLIKEREEFYCQILQKL